MPTSLDELLRPPDERGQKEKPKAGYKAEEGKDRSNGWLVLQRVKGPRVVCSYLRLDDWEYDHEENTGCITLYFTRGMVAVIRGRDMGSLVTGLLLRTLTEIVEFNPGKHEKPAPGAPVVEKIEITKPELEQKEKPKTGYKADEQLEEIGGAR